MDNVVEYLTGDEFATVTAHRQKLKNQLEKLAEERPDDCKITVRNQDGTIMAKIPTSWVKISPPKKLSEETREKLSERFKAMHNDLKHK